MRQNYEEKKGRRNTEARLVVTGRAGVTWVAGQGHTGRFKVMVVILKRAWCQKPSHLTCRHLYVCPVFNQADF